MEKKKVQRKIIKIVKNLYFFDCQDYIFLILYIADSLIHLYIFYIKYNII